MIKIPMDAKTLRTSLGLNQELFADLIGSQSRSVSRWESGRCKPTGASLAVMNAIQHALDSYPSQKQDIIKMLKVAARLGGLAYLLFYLFEQHLNAVKKGRIS